MYFKTILLSTTCISQFLENESLIFFFWIRFWYNGRLLYIWRGLLVEKLEVFCCSCLSVDLSVTPKFETDISCRLKDKRFHQTQLSIVAWIFFSTSKIQTPPTTFSLKYLYQTQVILTFVKNFLKLGHYLFTCIGLGPSTISKYLNLHVFYISWRSRITNRT